MFVRKMPSENRSRRLLAALRDSPFTYEPVGASREDLVAAPAGYRLARYETILGRGDAVFERAVHVLGELGNYPASFTRVVRPDRIAPDAVFATVASHPGFVSVHPCRIIYTIDMDRRWGFGFGTLRGHAASGEERFVVTLDPDDGTVRYAVQAFSRPGGRLMRLGAPIVQAYQRRFRRETLVEMRRRTAG